MDEVLERSVEELTRWVELVRADRDRGADVDHAVAMLRERMASSNRAVVDMPDVAHKFEVLSGAQANVEGIGRYLDSSTA